MNKIISVAAIGLALTFGSAFAAGALLEDKTVMGSFFTDDSLSTMRSPDEMKAAWAKLSADDQKAVKDAARRTLRPTSRRSARTSRACSSSCI